MDVKIPVELQTIKLTDIVDIATDRSETRETVQFKTTGAGTEDSLSTGNDEANKVAVSGEKQTKPTKIFLKTQSNGTQKYVFVRPRGTVLNKTSIEESRRLVNEIATHGIPDKGLIRPIPTVQRAGSVKNTVTQTSNLTDKDSNTAKLVFSIPPNAPEQETESDKRKSLLLPGKF